MATHNGKSLNLYPTPDRPIPKPILAGAGFVALATLVAIAVGRLTGIGVAATPEIASLASRDLVLDEHADGSVAILDAASRKALAASGIGEGSFAVEVLRNLQRNRERKGADTSAPFTLALKADGRLVVEDGQTPQKVELRAFGEGQAKAFADLLPAPSPAPDPTTASAEPPKGALR